MDVRIVDIGKMEPIEVEALAEDYLKGNPNGTFIARAEDSLQGAVIFGYFQARQFDYQVVELLPSDRVRDSNPICRSLESSDNLEGVEFGIKFVRREQ